MLKVNWIYIFNVYDSCTLKNVVSKTFLLKKKNTKTGTVIANDVKGLTTTFKTRKYTLLLPAKFIVTNITSLERSIKRKYKMFSFVRQNNQ